MNHNGFSEPEELEFLVERGIIAIRLAFPNRMEIDRHGNLLAFESEAYRLTEGRLKKTKTVDVYFLEKP